jgi:uncharacterized protein (DUF362 family)
MSVDVPTAAVALGHHGYPETAPFDPAAGHPEYRGPVSSRPNAAYEGVRAALALLYPPGDRYGAGARWNPLQELIEPGQTVFIKPNLVDHEHRFGGDVWSVITHPSVVRAVADYVALALRGDGRIVIGDNPHVDCHWDELADLYGMGALAERIGDVGGVPVEFVDLRSWHMPDLTDYGWRSARRSLDGDPLGAHVVDRRTSYLDGRPWWLFRGTYNERLETIRAHRGGHRYAFARTIWDADTYVSVPKLKAHAKVGATLNIKGLIGTIVEKNSLVHWSIGYPRFGGDEYPDPDDRRDYARLYWQHAVTDLLPSRLQLAIRRRLGHTALGRGYRRAVTTDAQRRRLLRGAWDGNDTTWRMTADVHDAFVGAPGEPRRRTLSVIDGIVGGDTDGPHFPHRVAPGAVVAAERLLVADLVAARLMDFDIGNIAYLAALADAHALEPTGIEVRGVNGDFFSPGRRHLGFRPPNRWPALSLHGLEPAGDLLEESRRPARSASSPGGPSAAVPTPTTRSAA